MTSPSTPGLSWLNAAKETTAGLVLHELCPCRSWVRAMLKHRPYPSLPELCAANEEVMATLTHSDLAEAMAGHPPIGRTDVAGRASAREQSGLADASAGLRAEIRELNLAYQERFGHVFLVCATGLSGERIRDALRERITQPPSVERENVRTELGKINEIRLARLATATGAGIPAGQVASAGEG